MKEKCLLTSKNYHVKAYESENTWYVRCCESSIFLLFINYEKWKTDEVKV